MRMRAAIAGLAGLLIVLPVRADQDWDEREGRAVRSMYPAIQHLPDFPQIKETFEKGLSGDASVSAVLATLLKHANQDVATTAAQMLGRFPSAAASAALQESYNTEERLLVRVNALAGLARMKDPATAPLAVAALGGNDEAMQGAGLGALEALGDSAYSAAILLFYERHPDEISADGLEALGKLGDPPGSTSVRDKLVGVANNKGSNFALRYGAALGVSAMGMGNLVKPILDIEKTRDSQSNLILVRRAMARLAGKKGVTVNSQSVVDALLRDVEVRQRDKQDLWKRPLRAKFVSQNLFHVVSDGPDMTPDTQDDISTAEDLNAYLDRVFPDQFLSPQ
jgi:HEAT repeat protein